MKLSGFLWGGAAILATIGGWAFWLEGVDELVDGGDRVVERVDRSVERVDRVVDRIDRRIDRIDRAVDHAIDRPNAQFEAEMARLEQSIEDGEITRSEAISRAVEASIDGGRGPGTQRGSPAEEVAAAQAIMAEARSELAAARDEIQRARDEGRISQEVYSDTLTALGRAEQRVDDAAVARQY